MSVLARKDFLDLSAHLLLGNAPTTAVQRVHATMEHVLASLVTLVKIARSFE